MTFVRTTRTTVHQYKQINYQRRKQDNLTRIFMENHEQTVIDNNRNMPQIIDVKLFIQPCVSWVVLLWITISWCHTVVR